MSGDRKIVWGELVLDAITHKPTADALRRAVADADHGPVWITEGGKRIAAVVNAEMAEAALVIRDAQRYCGMEFFDAIGAIRRQHPGMEGQ